MCTIPTRLLSSVLLPDPLGPTRETTCPGLALTVMPRITGSPPYPAVTFRADSGRPCRGSSADKVGLHDLAAATQLLQGSLRQALALGPHHHPAIHTVP